MGCGIERAQDIHKQTYLPSKYYLQYKAYQPRFPSLNLKIILDMLLTLSDHRNYVQVAEIGFSMQPPVKKIKSIKLKLESPMFCNTTIELTFC